MSEYVVQHFKLPFLLKFVQLLIGQVLDGRGHLLEFPLEPLPEMLVVRLSSELDPVLAVLRGQGQSSDVLEVLFEVMQVCLGGGVAMDDHQFREEELKGKRDGGGQEGGK